MMKHKKFLTNLLISIAIVGSIYGCTIYFALQERKKNEEIHRKDKERRERINQSLRAAQQDRDSIGNTATNRKTAGKFIISSDDDYIDPYEDPDFDDLIPGEEYDEEFIDRSQGDPELYD